MCGALTMSSFAFSLLLCGHILDNFFCEMPAFFKTACAYNKLMDVTIYTLGVIYLALPLFFILVSYGIITQAVTKIKLGKGWEKVITPVVLNTCGVHLTVVSLFYGSVIYMYLQ